MKRINEKPDCPRCHRSDNLQRIAKGENDIRLIVIWWCKWCDREFSISKQFTDVIDKEGRI